MHNAIPLILAALIAVAIIVIGCFYLASPERVLGSFGLKPPASDADTRAWWNSGRRIWIGRADHDADRGQAVGTHSSARFRHHPFWRHVNRSGVGRLGIASGLHSWGNLRGDACRRPFVDPCHLRKMPLTVLVDREGRSRSAMRRWRSIGLRSRHQRAPRRIGEQDVIEEGGRISARFIVQRNLQ